MWHFFSIFTFAFLFINSIFADIRPLTGISEFDVVMTIFPEIDRDKHMKEIVSSFEKIGTVKFSEENLFTATECFPLLSFSIDDEKRGVIAVIAEVEVLINRCRIGTVIWRKDFYDTEGSSVPVFLEDGTVEFRKVEKSEEEKNLSFPARMIREFEQEYNQVNSGRPVFHIHPNFLKELFQGTT